MPPKTKEEMKEYNRQVYLKRKERKMNTNASNTSLLSSQSTNQSTSQPIELIITELQESEEKEVQPFIEEEELENVEEIMRELMVEMFEDEKDEIIEGTVKYIYYKLYHKIHAFQKMYKKELSPEYRNWIYNWRNVNKEFYENQL